MVRDDDDELLTPELRARLLESVREGLHVSTTLDLLGLEWESVERWLSLDRAGVVGPWSGITVDLRRAIAEHERTLVIAANVALADPKNGKLALAYLRQRYPDRWDASQGQAMRMVATEKVLEALRARLTAIEYARVVAALQVDPPKPAAQEATPVTH